MKISLNKISKTPLEFDIKKDKITFKGFLQYDSAKLILLKAKLNGKIETACDVCAEDFLLDIDEDVEFYISDGIYTKNQDLFLDVVESFDSMIDLQEIMNSEIELILSDYKSCGNCAGSDYIVE